MDVEIGRGRAGELRDQLLLAPGIDSCVAYSAIHLIALRGRARGGARACSFWSVPETNELFSF
jgi:hypothetical protein